MARILAKKTESSFAPSDSFRRCATFWRGTAVPMAVSTAAKMRNAPESLIRQGVKALAKEAAPTASSAIGQAAKTGTPATGAQVGQWVRMQLSNDSEIESHPEDVSEVQKRDPGAKIVQ
jgi:hypothetical protein